MNLFEEMLMSEVKDTQEQSKVEIEVKNFGPISEAKIDLRPLTVFVGPSNTGKTYFATLVYALHGIFEGFLRVPLPNLFKSSYRIFSKPHNNPTAAAAALASTDEEAPEIVNKLTTKHRHFKFLDLPKGIRELAQTTIKDPEFSQNNLLTELRRCYGFHNISGLVRDTQDQNSEMRMLIIEDETEESDSWLLPEEVGAWHFQKDEPVKEIAFHPRKGFSPKDYQDVAEGLYNRSVNLQQKYEKLKGESRREST